MGQNHYQQFMKTHPDLFPWHSDSETEMEPKSVRGPRAGNFGNPQAMKAWQAQGIHELLGVSDNWWSGKVLEHCVSAIERLRSNTGGKDLALFKVGITHALEPRYELYRANGWGKMLVLFSSVDLGKVEMLEAALILHYKGVQQCRNILKGGEGMRFASGHAKFEPPYFCYCVSERADCGHSVL